MVPISVPHLLNRPLLSILLTLIPITTNAPTVEAMRSQKTKKLPRRPCQKSSEEMRDRDATRDSGRVGGPIEVVLVGWRCELWVS
jgi:hypothetical protein